MDHWEERNLVDLVVLAGLGNHHLLAHPSNLGHQRARQIQGCLAIRECLVDLCRQVFRADLEILGFPEWHLMPHQVLLFFLATQDGHPSLEYLVFQGL